MSTGSTEPELNSYWFTSDHLVSLSLDKYGKVAVDFCSNQGARKEHSPSYVTEEQLRVEQKDQDLVRLDLVIMKLSSSAFVTNGSGVAIQHLEIDRREIREPPLKREQGRGQYMAFGEVFVDQRRTGFGMPYKFNGKELDCESGYYYYGARYYDPKVGRFLGVDPIAGDFPHLSSYNYAENSPVTYIDLHGLQKYYNREFGDPPEFYELDGPEDLISGKMAHNLVKGYQTAFGELYAMVKYYFEKDYQGNKTDFPNSINQEIGEGFNVVTGDNRLNSSGVIGDAHSKKGATSTVDAFPSIGFSSLQKLLPGQIENGFSTPVGESVENHSWIIETSSNRDTQYFTPTESNYYENAFKRWTNEDGSVEAQNMNE